MGTSRATATAVVAARPCSTGCAGRFSAFDARLRRGITAAEIAVLSELLARLHANVAPSEESS